MSYWVVTFRRDLSNKKIKKKAGMFLKILGWKFFPGNAFFETRVFLWSHTALVFSVHIVINMWHYHAVCPNVWQHTVGKRSLPVSRSFSLMQSSYSNLCAVMHSSSTSRALFQEPDATQVCPIVFICPTHKVCTPRVWEASCLLELTTTVQKKSILYEACWC